VVGRGRGGLTAPFRSVAVGGLVTAFGWAGGQQGAAPGSGYLPCPGAHAMKSGACTAPICLFFLNIFCSAFVVCRPARPTRGTAVGLQWWPLVGVGGPVLGGSSPSVHRAGAAALHR